MAFAHGVAQQDQGFIANAFGVHVWPFMYLGAKHMVTGYDHLLYLVGVIFFLSKLRDIAIFVSLFALGHSITLLVGVLSGLHVNPYLIDAIIGISICYKALENLSKFRFLNPKIAVFSFGLAHGFGLSSKLQDLALSTNGLIPNMLAFNLGVEIGQLLALVILLSSLSWLRKQPHYPAISNTVNIGLFGAGLMFFGMHFTGYLLR
ncbi:HupE/UreJ family protein [Alteromonas sp. 1_MG-2023]|uniref:HupE/UreJ family protein n=1 Tax=Alteromonas sp. 1_MG-2023 TaxID=3062669 RepID=UPI0026E460A6|nr:HupE/UreJ family protein [Alteromonas sp. 1_MG-2023]MDO6568914.1 HupE/UreJ family protein [Alteromonas sp. 1_MG-2023]